MIQNIFYFRSQHAGVFGLAFPGATRSDRHFEGFGQRKSTLVDAGCPAFCGEIGAKVFLFGLTGCGDEKGAFSKAFEVHNGTVAGTCQDKAGGAQQGLQGLCREVVVDGEPGGKRLIRRGWYGG